MKSFRGTILFTVIVIGAGLYSYFQVFKKGNEESEQKEKSSQVFKLKAEEISRIELHNLEQIIILQRDKENWSIEKPLADKADATQVKNFLDTVLREKSTDVVEEGEKLNLKTYGLDTPAFQLKLTGVQASSKAPSLTEDVSFGSVKAYDGSVYIRFGLENKVILAPSYFNSVLNKKADDFRNKNLFTSGIGEIDHFKIVGKEKLELKRDQTSWTMLEPKNYFAPTSGDNVQSFLDLVRNIKGTEIVSDSKVDAAILKKYHLDKPALTLSLHRAQAPQDYELKISDPKADKDQNIYLMGTDATSILKGVQSNLDTLNKQAFDFTNKHQAFTFSTLDLVHLKISTTHFNAQIDRVGNAWKNVIESEKRVLDGVKVDELISKFSHLEAKGLAKTSSAAFKNEIAALDSNNKTLFNMSWSEPFEDEKSKSPKHSEKAVPKGSKDSTTMVYVKTSKLKEILVLPLAQIENLAIKSVFKNPDPIQFSGAPPKDKNESSKIDRPTAAALDQNVPILNEKEKIK